jgi:hypothetical protein
MAKFTRRWFVNNSGVAAMMMMSLALAGTAAAQSDGGREPDLSDYPKLRVPAGYKVAFDTYAEGVQIWRWNGLAWVFVKPQALLYASGEEEGIVGIHYEGPTWESASGSYVVAAVIDRATPSADSIPWLLLGATKSDGPGIFEGVTHIQRVNTRGGIAPPVGGDFIGEEARVPYTAEYFFYRKQD